MIRTYASQALPATDDLPPRWLLTGPEGEVLGVVAYLGGGLFHALRSSDEAHFETNDRQKATRLIVGQWAVEKGSER